MAAGVCAPLTRRNIDRANALGVTVLGCVGDTNHTFGFHVPANRLPADDYSRTRCGKPVNPNQACAADFGMNKPWSRRWLAWLVASVKAGGMPDIVEIIGSLDGREALYWARWNNWRVKLYTGQGHVAWSHISCDRSKANNTVDLFAGWPDNPAPINPTRVEESAPAARMLKLTTPYMAGIDVKVVQARLQKFGYSILADGVYGPKTTTVVKQYQHNHGLDADGVVGPLTRARLGI